MIDPNPYLGSGLDEYPDEAMSDDDRRERTSV
jgi:hypothetical protein